LGRFICNFMHLLVHLTAAWKMGDFYIPLLVRRSDIPLLLFP